MRPLVATGIFVAVGVWFRYFDMLGLRGEPIGVSGWVLGGGRRFRHAVTGWSTRVAPFALFAVEVGVINYGIMFSFSLDRGTRTGPPQLRPFSS